MNAECGPAPDPNIDVKSKVMDEGADDRRSNRSGAACKRFILHAPFVRSQLDGVAAGEAGEVDIRSGGLKDGRVPDRPTEGDDIKTLKVGDKRHGMRSSGINCVA